MNVTKFIRKIHKVWRISRYPRLLPPLRYGVAAGIDHANVLFNLPLSTIVDVGANIGQFSLMASQAHPNANIYAFEPIPRAADRFEKIFSGNPKVKMRRCAIGATERTDKLHLSGRDDSSSLLPISDLQTAMHPGTAEVDQIDVAVKTLSQILTPSDLVEPALLKIDVQGAELEVLKGCASLLSRFKHIYLELSFVEFYSGQPLCHEVTSYLEAQGFLISGVYNLACDKNGVTVQADFLFTQH